MPALEYLALLAMGCAVGLLATSFNAILMRGELTNGFTVCLFAGGAFGGALAGMALDAGVIGPRDMIFCALAGYFAADVFVTVAGSRK